jgi:hypothetical protein
MYASLSPLPLNGSRIARPKRAQQSLAGAPDTPPLLRWSPPPPPPGTQWYKTATGRLNGRTFRVFSYTCVRQYSPIGIIGLTAMKSDKIGF